MAKDVSIPRGLLLASAIAGFVGVAAGAFGGHMLKQRLAPEDLAIHQVGVLYHLIHAAALLGLCALAARMQRPRLAIVAGWLWIAGIVLFAGSLYLLAITGASWLGALTPFGGIAFLSGWLLLAIGAIAPNRQARG